MMKNIVLRTTAIAVALAFGHALATEATPIAVPAGELVIALESLAKQSGVEFVYEVQQLKGLKTKGIQGDFTPENAVAKLLEGTQLTVTVHQSGAVLIAAPHANSRAARATDAEWDFRLVQSVADQAESAEGAAKGSDAAQNSSASSSATAAQKSGKREAGEVEEIVVTAQRREERLIDTPISIGVVQGESLDRDSSRAVSDILNQVGGVSVIETLPGSSIITVRGVAGDSLVGAATTGYYLDEVPFTFNTQGGVPDANAYDLARVEVLRGPQGTLYGANALSGVVRILTNDADLENFEAKGRARVSDTNGGDGNYGGDVALNVPLIPGELAVRGVASYAELGGFIDSSLSGTKRINDSTAEAYRFKANYQASDRFTAKLGFSRSSIDNGAPSSSQADLTTPLSDYQTDLRKYDTYNLIANYAWPAVSLLSSTSYLDYEAASRAEFLLGGVFNLNIFNGAKLRSFSQEFRLSSHFTGPWQWTAGAIYKDTIQHYLQIALAFSPSPGEGQTESRSNAVFGELTRSFDDGKFELTGGIRYFRDELEQLSLSEFFGPTTPPLHKNFNKVTGRLVLTYKPEENRMFYGSVATGFRSGQQNSFAVTTVDPSFAAVKPDSLLTYEVGTKGAWSGGTVTYDAAVYYTDWQDLQQSIILPIGFFAGVNGGRAGGAGFDGSIAYQPTRKLSLHAAVGWNDLKFREDLFSSEVVLFSKDGRLNNSPQWTGFVGGSFNMATPMAGMEVVLAGSFNYRSSIQSRYLTGNVLSITESDSLRTFKASVGVEKDRWSAELYGENLLDDRAAISPPEAGIAFNSVRQRPRTIGLQVTFMH